MKEDYTAVRRLLRVVYYQKRGTHESGADLLRDDPGSGESSTAGIERMTFKVVVNTDLAA